MADAIAAFVCEQKPTKAIEDLFPFVTIAEAARAHERGALVDHRWDECLAWPAGGAGKGALVPLLAAAARRPRLRGLLPFVDLGALRFSRTTGQPYALVGARAVAHGPDRYEVVAGELLEQSLGTGDAAWAAAALDDALPADVGPAVDATADD